MAKEMLMTGRKVGAGEAKESGLVNKVVEHETLMDEAQTMMKSILANAPIAVKVCKQLVNQGMTMSLADGLVLEAKLNGMLAETADAKEGVKSFFEKRLPNFQNK